MTQLVISDSADTDVAVYLLGAAKKKRKKNLSVGIRKKESLNIAVENVLKYRPRSTCNHYSI